MSQIRAHLLLLPGLLLLLLSPLQARVIGKVTMPRDGNISAVILDEGGQIIRTLLELSPTVKGTVVELNWDGLDDVGKKAPAGEYRWKTLSGLAKGVDDGWIGDMGNPVGKGEHGAHVISVAVDEEGNVYETSGWEEAHQEVRVWSADGEELRYRASGGGRAIAVDTRYIYQLVGDGKDSAVKRFTRDTLLLRPWTGTLFGTLTMDGGVNALGVGDEVIWLCGADRVQIHDKATGDLLRAIPCPTPLAVAVDARGYGWVAHSGDRVSEFSPDGAKGREIEGLKNPAALTFGGANHHLYIGERDSGQLLEYDSATLQCVRALFSAARPGPVSDTALLWPLAGGTSVAVDKIGRITVADIGNHRVMTFHADGTLLRMRYSEMVMAPMVDPAVNPNTVLSNNMEYEVDYQPGANYGKWRVINNWYGSGGAGIRRKLDGRDYLFTFNGRNVRIFDLTNNAMRECAGLGVDDTGMYTWADSNGDGTRQDDEITRTEGAGNYSVLAPGLWIDHQGHLWIANWGGATVRVARENFDERGNPLYNWANRKTVIPLDDSQWKCRPNNLRVDPLNGEIYRISNSEYYTVPNQWFWMGGSVVERYTPDGVRISAFPILGGKPVVVIATDTDGRFFYTGHSDGDQHWIRMYTSDGLLVTICRMGGPSGNNGGWMDHGMALTAFRHPVTGVHYAYAEEVYWGKAIRYRIDNLDTVQRPGEGRFTWTEEN